MTDATPRDALLTTDDVSDFCKVTSRTVRNWMRSGRLRYLQIGRCVRFDPQDLQAFLETSKVTDQP